MVLEGNLGLRISDILTPHLCDIVRNGARYRLEIMEQKTGKRLIFPLTERAVQKPLSIVYDYLGYEGISTHSFRKWYATEIYKNNGYDIALVQRLHQHSSAATTQRYIGIEPQRIEQAIQYHSVSDTGNGVLF